MGERATVQRRWVESGKSDIATGVLFGAARISFRHRWTRRSSTSHAGNQARSALQPGASHWVIDAYVITFGSLLLFAGRLGDLIGP
jgi:hypothetical protein